METGQDCVWNEIMKFGVLWPMTADRLPLRIMDYDATGNDGIGSVDLRLKKVVKTCSSHDGVLVWKQIYGAPISKGLVDLNFAG